VRFPTEAAAHSAQAERPFHVNRCSACGGIRTFCIAALEEALERYDAPRVFNTDQGAQFTCEGFTSVLADHGVQVSRDGRGRWMDNVFIERLWLAFRS